jgi:hypothetical protein
MTHTYEELKHKPLAMLRKGKKLLARQRPSIRRGLRPDGGRRYA